MATTVFTGWRRVTPGDCMACGFDDGWACDGRGTIYCDCETCPECHKFDGHVGDCPTRCPCCHVPDGGAHDADCYEQGVRE